MSGVSELSSAVPLKPILSPAEVLAHPNFPAAHEAFVDEMAMVYIRQTRRRGLNDFRQGACFQLLVCFDAARDPANPETLFTNARVIQAMGQFGVRDGRAVAELIGRLREDGYATVGRAAHDRRVIEMRATEKAREADREWVQILHRPLSILEPDREEHRLGLARDPLYHTMFRATSLPLLHLAAASMEGHPGADYFVQQSQGSRVMMQLMQAVRGRPDRRTEPGFYGWAAEHAGVSRPHVRKILRGAEALGLVELSGSPVAVTVTPAFAEEVRRWTAACISTSHTNSRMAWAAMSGRT